MKKINIKNVNIKGGNQGYFLKHFLFAKRINIHDGVGVHGRPIYYLNKYINLKTEGMYKRKT